jgi:short-subunit dehydrogenase
VNPFQVQGKLALITGATRGIGLGAAHALAQAGANLMLAGRDQEELERAAADLRKTASQVHVLPFDLLRPKQSRPGWMVPSTGSARRTSS